jgi:hypothetical protein
MRINKISKEFIEECLNQNMSQGEIADISKINSKPITQIQVFNFHLPYIKKLYNINSDNPFINPKEINNGYTWIESLKNKGIILKSDNSLVNQYCNLIKSRLNNNFNNCINII